MAEGARYCAICGRDLQAGAAAPTMDPQAAFGLSPETNGKAIFSLVSGILFIILPFSIVAVIFGYLALSEIRKSPGRFTGRGLAITGIVLGYVGVACIIGFFGLGIYGIREESRRSAQGVGTVIEKRAIDKRAAENSVVASVRSLNAAEIAYSQAHHNAGYTCSIEDLNKAWGVDHDIASGRSHGYVFSLQDCKSAKPAGPIVKYRVVAYPEASGNAAQAAYCSDESDVIRTAKSGLAQDCLNKGVLLPQNDVNHPAKWEEDSSD